MGSLTAALFVPTVVMAERKWLLIRSQCDEIALQLFCSFQNDDSSGCRGFDEWRGCVLRMQCQADNKNTLCEAAL